MKYIGGIERPDDYPSVLERIDQLSTTPGWKPYQGDWNIWTSPSGVHYGEESAWHIINRQRTKTKKEEPLDPPTK
jgi:hypothetical protein